MASGVGGLHRGGVVDAHYRGIRLNSRLNSSHASSPAPISDISVTWGVALVARQLSPSFKLGEVVIEFLFLSVSFARCSLATCSSCDFSILKAHDLAKFSGICRSVRSKACAKGLQGVSRVHGRVPDRGRKNNKVIYSSISAIYGTFPETRPYNSLKLVRASRRGVRARGWIVLELGVSLPPTSWA